MEFDLERDAALDDYLQVERQRRRDYRWRTLLMLLAQALVAIAVLRACHPGPTPPVPPMSSVPTTPARPA